MEEVFILKHGNLDMVALTLIGNMASQIDLSDHVIVLYLIQSKM